jgi:hypothetical protein
MKTKLLILLLIGIILISCNQPQTDIPTLNIEVKQIITDLDHLILDTDGNVWAWGSNSTGLSGNKPRRLNSIPTIIDSLNDIIAIDCMAGVAFAADGNGNIWYWGLPLLWVIPYDSLISTPRIISNQQNVKQINIVDENIYLLLDNGTVKYLQWNPYNPTHYINPIEIPELSSIKQLSGILALKYDGTLIEIPEYRFKTQDSGGLDSILNNIHLIQNFPVSHSLALTNDSSIISWGINKVGVLGNGTFEDNPLPTRIDTLKNIVSISTQGARCLALDSRGTVWFWGLLNNDYDKNIHEYLSIPTIIEDFYDVKMI